MWLFHQWHPARLARAGGPCYSSTSQFDVDGLLVPDAQTPLSELFRGRPLIDDDIDAAALDEKLPETYRRRMAHVSSHVQPRLLAIADEVIACCEPLAKHFSRRHDSVSLLAPSLIAPMPMLP